MKHDVVVASPRAGITRDKYSANKGRHPTPACPPPSPGPLPPPLTPHYLRNVARGWRARPPAIFNKSSRVSHGRWPPCGGTRGTGGGGGGGRCIRSAFYFVATRMCALSLSFFSRFSFFCACFTPPLDFFFHPFWSTLDCSATTNQDHLTGNTPRTRHLCPRHPRRPSASHFCFPSSLPRPPPPSFCRRRRHRHTFTDQFVR